jgi:hypothetical protein
VSSVEVFQLRSTEKAPTLVAVNPVGTVGGVVSEEGGPPMKLVSTVASSKAMSKPELLPGLPSRSRPTGALPSEYVPLRDVTLAPSSQTSAVLAAPLMVA